MDQLQLEVHSLLLNSVAPRTHFVYQCAWQFFRWFILRHDFLATSSFPSLQQLVHFIAFLAVNGYAAATIASYVSGIASTLRLHNFPDITKHFIVKRMLDGCRRRHGRRDLRRPITISVLRKIIPALTAVCRNQFEAHLFRTAFLLAFYGFLRVGELTTTTRAAEPTLRRSDVTLHHTSSGSVVNLNIRFSKTDQFGRGCVISIPAASHADVALCPVNATAQYLSISPAHDGSFLSHFDGSSVTRSQFAAVLSRALRFCGVYDARFTSHSFRIGAATSAAMAGIPENEIQRMGRWHSGVYRRYIRITNAFLR